MEIAARLVLFALLLTAVPAVAERVLRVKDGDTLVVTSAGREVVVQLADADAPELRQPRGREASTVLASLVAGRDVTLQLVDIDIYGRVVAYVLVDGGNVNAEMVRRGLAWVPRRYDPPLALVQLEYEAQAARRGVWADPEPTPPWAWRKHARATSAMSDLPNAGTNVQCGSKRYCHEMTSCAEAKAHLRQCGLRSIDGDKDGVPCEGLCY